MHLLLWISAVVGRYRPHLMIVMIFVTQNNFSNGPGISDRLLGFYPSKNKNIYLCKTHWVMRHHLGTVFPISAKSV